MRTCYRLCNIPWPEHVAHLPVSPRARENDTSSLEYSATTDATIDEVDVWIQDWLHDTTTSSPTILNFQLS